MNINLNGTIKSLTPYAKVEGVVKPIKGVWANIDGTIKKIWPKTPTGDTPLTGEYNLLSYSTSNHLSGTIFIIKSYFHKNSIEIGYATNRIALFSIGTDFSLTLVKSHQRDPSLSSFNYNILSGVDPFNLDQSLAYIVSTTRNVNERWLFKEDDYTVISSAILTRSTSNTTPTWISDGFWTKHGRMEARRSFDFSTRNLRLPSGTITANNATLYPIDVSGCGEYVFHYRAGQINALKINESSETALGTLTVANVQYAKFSKKYDHIIYTQTTSPGLKFLTYKNGVSQVTKSSDDFTFTAVRFFEVFIRDGEEYIIQVTNAGDSNQYKAEITLFINKEDGAELISTTLVNTREFVTRVKTSLSYDNTKLIFAAEGGIEIFEIK